jgi:hypothetical protein
MRGQSPPFMEKTDQPLASALVVLPTNKNITQ